MYFLRFIDIADVRTLVLVNVAHITAIQTAPSQKDTILFVAPNLYYRAEVELGKVQEALQYLFTLERGGVADV